MNASRYAAVILAAGLSSRMERFKPLLSLGKETIADHVISTFQQNGIEVYVVAGWHKEELCAGIKTENIQIVENRNYNDGMFTSIQTGLRYISNHGYTNIFIIPVDIPLVRSFTLKQMLKASEEQPPKICYPVFDIIRGHPVLIPAAIIPAILDTPKNSNLKKVLESFENLAMEIQVPDENILFDIDNIIDYEELLKRYEYDEIPSERECEVILTEFCKVSDEVLKHSLKVAGVAVNIAHSLTIAGKKPDLKIVRAAAMLHDIAKGKPNHDVTGACMLRDMGFGRTGDMIAVHTDLSEDVRGDTLETKVVYLADKYVAGTGLVPLHERFEKSLQRFGTTAEIKANIIQRRERAFKVKKELDDYLGDPLEKVIFQ